MTITCRMYCIAVLIGVISQPVAAQVEDPETTPPPRQNIELLEGLSTLEAIRSTSPGLDENTETGMGMSMMGGTDMVPTARQLLLQQIDQLRLMLNAPDADRKELEKMLREALAEYFVLDMEERVREFDKIKARVVQMESKLKARLDRRYEVVELQIQQMLHKADGLDFFVPDSGSSGPGMPGETGMMSSGYGSGGEGMMGGMMGGGGGRGAGMGPGMGMAPGVTPIGLPGSSAGGMGGPQEVLAATIGYDVGFGMTRYLRFPGKPLKSSDPLNIYLALDAKSDRENEFSKLDLGASDEAKLKALLLGMHNFADLFKHFPAPASRRDRSEMPHSWRVALLPMLGHAELYKQYRFNEPWDSKSNLKLVEKMPAVFGSKGDPDSKSGKTRFQMLVGGGAAFDLSRPTEMRDITDGTSNTIALAVANSSVPWTKPEDIQFVPSASQAKLAPSQLVALCDGRVRKLPAGGEQMLTIFATRAGGEPTPQ